MSNPNQITANNIQGVVNTASLSSVVTDLVDMIGETGKIMKVNSIFISNAVDFRATIDTDLVYQPIEAGDSFVTMKYYKTPANEASGITEAERFDSIDAFPILNDYEVGAGQTLQVLDKYIYVESGDKLMIKGSHNLLRAISFSESIEA